MVKTYQKVLTLLHDPKFLVKFNGWATLVWSQSILWIVAMSVWANVAGHWSSYVAARAAEKKS